MNCLCHHEMKLVKTGKETKTYVCYNKQCDVLRIITSLKDVLGQIKEEYD